jgi:hypothetical protein
MRKFDILTIGLVLLTVTSSISQERKAFHKYCLVASVTGGPSKALYTTKDLNGEKIHSAILDGRIDPLITEYGLTDKIGIGITRGGENFDVNANTFYGQNISEVNNGHIMFVTTKYLTADASYHYYTTKRLDLSVFGSFGYYMISGNAGNINPLTKSYEGQQFSYDARGGIIRTGARARWYFSKRWGLMTMLYGFKGYAKEPFDQSQISDGNGKGGIITTLTGGGFETGICFRFGKQRNVNTETPEPRKEKKKSRKIDPDDNNERTPLISVVWD